MGMTADEAQELRDWVKGIKPDCIISGRIGHQKGDYMTTGDNFIPRLPYDGDWEVPATVNDTWNKVITGGHVIALLVSDKMCIRDSKIENTLKEFFIRGRMI